MISYVSSKSKQKIALLRVLEDSDWISCRSITDNLEKAYQEAHNTDVFYLYSQVPTLMVIDNIINSAPEIISFIDHRIRLLEVLKSPKLVKYLKLNNVKIIIHVFGCFFDRLTEYFEAGEILRDLEVVFVAASPRHKDLVSKIIPSNSVSLIPFPVEFNYFKFDQNMRLQYRKKLPIKDTDLLFLYAGRISAQKNVEIAMKHLSEQRKKDKRIKFLYLGNFDHYEPYFGQSFLGQMEQVNSKILKDIDPNNEWCFHLPQVNQDDLKGFLAAADAYISLSTYRGDDFAMAVAEAKAMGLAAFLTDWGGHSGYKGLPETYFAPVELKENDLLINLPHQFLNLSFSSNREDIAKECAKKFSVSSVSSEISKMIRDQYPPFKGINSKQVFLRKMINTVGFDLLNKAKAVYEAYYR